MYYSQNSYSHFHNTYLGEVAIILKETSTKNGLDSNTGTIMKSKEMMQELWNMSILYQNKFQNISLSKHSNKFVIT